MDKLYTILNETEEMTYHSAVQKYPDSCLLLKLVRTLSKSDGIADDSIFSVVAISDNIEGIIACEKHLGTRGDKRFTSAIGWNLWLKDNLDGGCVLQCES